MKASCKVSIRLVRGVKYFRVLLLAVRRKGLESPYKRLFTHRLTRCLEHHSLTLFKRSATLDSRRCSHPAFQITCEHASPLVLGSTIVYLLEDGYTKRAEISFPARPYADFARARTERELPVLVTSRIPTHTRSLLAKRAG